MILCSNNTLMGPNLFRNYYLSVCDTKLSNLIKDKSLGMAQLLQIYSISEIKESLQSINIDSYNNLYIPEQTNSSKILRYLEYGGEGVKPIHFFSDINNKFKGGN